MAARKPPAAGGAAGNAARRLLGGIQAGAARGANTVRRFLSRIAGGGLTAANVGARSKGIRQRFGAAGPTPTQRGRIERAGLASPVRFGGTGGQQG